VKDVKHIVSVLAISILGMMYASLLLKNEREETVALFKGLKSFFDYGTVFWFIITARVR
jgi:hypothetical protein